MFTLPRQESFHPPAQPDAGASNPNPDHVLLAVRAYIADRTNSTTATSSTSEGHRIQVSFFAAEPPALSHLCVYCPDAAFAAGLRVPRQPHTLRRRHPLLLRPLWRRDPLRRLRLQRRRHGSRVARLAPEAKAPHLSRQHWPRRKRFVLHLHHEKTGRWRRKVVSRKILVTDSADDNGKDLKDEVLDFTSTKAIALHGGSTIAWVDLRRAVLLCDVLDEDPVAYYMPLPEPLNHRNEEYLESPADPCFLRDAVGGRNSVKFVVDFDDVVENSGGVLASLCPDKSRGLEEDNVPPLRVPTLCDRDNVLYLTSKPNRRGKGSVAAVDTSTKTLGSVIPMSDERVIGYALTYVHCTFSKRST